MPSKATAGRQSKRKHESFDTSRQQPSPRGGRHAPLQLPALKRKAVPEPNLELFRTYGILTVSSVLSPDEATALIALAEQHGFEHQNSRGPAFGEAVRDNGRIAIQSTDFAKHLWQSRGLDHVFHNSIPGGLKATGLNPNIRIYKYGPGQHFGKHIDESVQLDAHTATRYTLLVYLNGSDETASADAVLPRLRGGETVFYDGKKSREVARFKPEVGMALLHSHGDECLEHEALPVQHGCKYVLRSDVSFAC